jgi:hypothetical protein
MLDGCRLHKRFCFVQLSEEHNVNLASHRKAYLEGHPEGDAAVTHKHGMYRVKGKLQVRI